MNSLDLTTRLLSFVAAAGVALSIFNAVPLMTGTLPAVQTARAAQVEHLATNDATGFTTVAMAGRVFAATVR